MGESQEDYAVARIGSLIITDIRIPEYARKKLEETELTPEEQAIFDKVMFFFNKRTEGRDTCDFSDIVEAARDAGLID